MFVCSLSRIPTTAATNNSGNNTGGLWLYGSHYLTGFYQEWWPNMLCCVVGLRCTGVASTGRTD